MSDESPDSYAEDTISDAYDRGYKQAKEDWAERCERAEKDAAVIVAALVEKLGGEVRLEHSDLERVALKTLQKSEEPMRGAITFRVIT